MGQHTAVGAPGLRDRVFPIHAGSRGFNSHGGTCPNDFSDPTDQDIHTQCALSWKTVVSEWRLGDCSVTERGQWLPTYQTSKTVHVHANTLQTRRGQPHVTRCTRPWFRIITTPLQELDYKQHIAKERALVTGVCNNG